jgi:hypothetical protein
MGGDIVKIKWLEHYTIDIERDFNLVPVEFNKDQIDEVEIGPVIKNSDGKEVVDIKFQDNSVGYSVPKKWFEKVN